MGWFGLRKKLHPIINKLYAVLLAEGFTGTYINQITAHDYMIKANIYLPENVERADLEKILPNLQQEMGATDIKLGKTDGKRIEILFGMRELQNTDFSSSLLQPGTLKVEFPSAYGFHTVDFEDGASCHMLNGGVTRMGKTCFLLYLTTTLFLQMQGKMKLYISSAKLKDYYPFQDIPQVQMAKGEEELQDILDDIVEEYKRRDELLYSPQFRKATDAKSIRKLYPESYHLFKPIFLIIDEYARFAQNKYIQAKVTEIVETAGFVNVHVIIASQRPDAATVLKSRIRANLLCRIAFTTADRKNSEIILDREGAEKLGKIPGRGILVDSDSHIVQVPFLDVVECDKLLEEYRHEQTTKGQDDSGNTGEVQSGKPQPIGPPSLQGQQQPGKRSEPGTQAYDTEWLYYTDTTRKR